MTTSRRPRHLAAALLPCATTDSVGTAPPIHTAVLLEEVHEIIEKLEEEGTQERRVEIRKYGTREYNLRARNLGMVGFDAMLNGHRSGLARAPRA
jgi:hypothetical protein